ncbi:MAG: hypothetical protein ACOX56_01240 [Acholeplasmataceae bacterium]|jgi:sugar phosphate isomerase/epimerase
MRIASYFDYYDWTIDKQIKLYETNQLDYFILRRVDGFGFLNYQDRLTEISFKLRKVKIGFFDPLLAPINLDDENHINQLMAAAKFAKKVKTKNLVIQIKPFTNESTKKEIKTYLKKIKKHTKRLNILIKIDNQNDMFVFHKIANEIKLRKIQLIFNPAVIYRKNTSPLSSYSLMRKKIGLFEVADTAEDGEDILVGYGAIKMKELFKNLFIDRYQHLITLNSNLDDVFENFGVNPLDVERKNKRQNLDKYLETIQKMGYVIYDKENEVSFEDIIAHQIKLLKIVFK